MNKFNILLLVTVFFFSQNLFSQDEAIFASEQQRFNAQISFDTEALDDLLLDELIYIHSNTLIETKADFIKSVASKKIVYQEMNLKHHLLRRYKKMAVITGLVEVNGLYNGENFTVELFYTSIYKKYKRNWLLVSWQSTSKK